MTIRLAIRNILKFVVEVLFSALAPVILVLAGALMAAGGLSLDWEWLLYGGVITATLGILPIVGLFQGD